jgi:flagellum-specific peptidoglycan hydrolase FlgJ
MTAKTFQYWFYAARLLHPNVKVTARIPLAQSALESGSTWNSHMATAYNNFFGMTKPVLRKFTASGTYTTPKGVVFLTYSSPLQCISDYLMFLDQLGLTTDDKLQAYIDSGRYTKDAGYKQHLQRVVNEQGPLLVNPSQVAVIASAAALATFFGIKQIAKYV